MVEIGGKPILKYIMKSLSVHGINDFIICCGYKGYVIKEYFDNYFRHVTDFTIDLKTGERTVLSRPREEWRITLIDTGQALRQVAVLGDQRPHRWHISDDLWRWN